jgi:hypothetical protein
METAKAVSFRGGTQGRKADSVFENPSIATRGAIGTLRGIQRDETSGRAYNNAIV